MKKIALDCDGVILDYNQTWGKILATFLNKEVLPKKVAYFAHNVFDYHLSENETKKFYDMFHEHGWCQMQALQGALKAINILQKKNFDIHIVTSIPQSAHLYRKNNLQHLGIDFSSLHTVGFQHNINMKKDIINVIEPIYFVDDLLQNFEGVKPTTNCVLINIEGEDNPNYLYQEKNRIALHSTHNCLLDFAKML